MRFQCVLLQFSDVVHILRVNCGNIISDRFGQLVNEIFSLERTFFTVWDFDFQGSRSLLYGAWNLGTPSRCIIRWLHITYWLPRWQADAVADHVSFAQITCTTTFCSPQWHSVDCYSDKDSTGCRNRQQIKVVICSNVVLSPTVAAVQSVTTDQDLTPSKNIRC